MRKESFLGIFTVFLLIVGLLNEFACKKGSPSLPEAAKVFVYSEIDTQAIAAQTGVKFNVIKADSQGADIRYKFLWLSFANEPDRNKVEGVVKSMIDALIAKYPRSFHSFTLHLFYEKDLKDKPENSQPFACATYLPEGDKAKVGRIPIDDYKDYKLAITYMK